MKKLLRLVTFCHSLIKFTLTVCRISPISAAEGFDSFRGVLVSPACLLQGRFTHVPFSFRFIVTDITELQAVLCDSETFFFLHPLTFTFQ